jgi:hypothetical protein
VTGPFSAAGREAVGAALDAQVPGATELGAVAYVERLLTALDHDPPRIWAAPGAWADGDGAPGPAWLPLGPWERAAWAERIAGWREVYARVVAGAATEDDDAVVFAHACEATYGDPAYGGNRASAAWVAVAFPEPLFPPRRSTP